MQTRKTLNEFFVRWTDDGSAIQGLHLAEREAFLADDGTELTARLLPPRAVLSTDAASLADVASAINASALAQLAQAQTDLATATAARDAALAQVQHMQAQVAELAPAAVNGVPQEVSMQQAQRELLRTLTVNPTGGTLLDVIEAAIEAIPDAAARRDAQIVWTKSGAVKRTNALLVQLEPVVQHALGLADAAATGAAIDKLFINAATL